MSEPSRLLDRGATDDELRLLLAGAAEEPPADGLAKLAASLNVVLAPAVGNAVKLGAPSPWRSLASKLTAKWVALTLATTGVVAGALFAHRASQHGVGRHDVAADAVHGKTVATLADDARDVAPSGSNRTSAASQNGRDPSGVTPDVEVVAGAATSENGAGSATAHDEIAAGVATPGRGSATGAVTSQRGHGANPAVLARATTLAERTARAKGQMGAEAEPAAATGASSTSPTVPTEARREEPRATQSIAGEVAALDGVRARLNESDAPGALGALDEYRRDYPEGALGQEATLLRIEALVASGDVARARSAAERFLRDHPSTPHKKRLRTLIGGS